MAHAAVHAVEDEFVKIKREVYRDLKIVVSEGHTIFNECENVIAKLWHLIIDNKWTHLFEEAFALVREIAKKLKDTSLAGLHNMCDYIKFLFAHLYWVPTEERDGRNIYNHICEFYFVLDQKPLLALQNKIEPHDVAPPLTKLSSWMVEYAQVQGRFLDTTASISPKTIESFRDANGFNLDDYIPPPSGYLTFNQLFARNFRPGKRPVSDPYDDHVIVSPADSTPVVTTSMPISEHNTIYVPNPLQDVNLKGLTWSIGELLQGSKYSKAFVGGTFTHSFLNTFDYHRLHVPLPGKVLESIVIQGQVYLEVGVAPDTSTEENASHVAQPVVPARDFASVSALAMAAPPSGLKLVTVRGAPSRTFSVGQSSSSSAAAAFFGGPAGTPTPTPTPGPAPTDSFDAGDNTGYQFAQARGLCVLDTGRGLVAILPIGMAQVSSVVMTAKEGAVLAKGEEFGYFQFGGSDHIVLYSKEIKPKFTEKFLAKKHHLQGEIIARYDF